MRNPGPTAGTDARTSGARTGTIPTHPARSQASASTHPPPGSRPTTPRRTSSISSRHNTPLSHIHQAELPRESGQAPGHCQPPTQHKEGASTA